MTRDEALDALAAHLNPNTPRYALPFAEEAAIFLRDNPEVARALGIGRPQGTHNPWDYVCVVRVDGEPYGDDDRCPICRPVNP